MRHCPRARAGRYYFHAYCDRYKNTVTVIQSNGRYFGGTNVGAWNQRSSANSQYQMLFSLTLNQALKQTSTLSNTIMYRSGSFGPFVSAQQQQQQQMLALHKRLAFVLRVARSNVYDSYRMSSCRMSDVPSLWPSPRSGDTAPLTTAICTCTPTCTETAIRSARITNSRRVTAATMPRWHSAARLALRIKRFKRTRWRPITTSDGT